jgi:hypothetical protein
MNFLAKLPARMTLSAAAVLTVLGAAAAGAAPAIAAGPSPSPSGTGAKIHWHAFKLKNFWTSASTAKQPTGRPAWAVQSGVVYLRGAITNPSSSNGSIFGTLPLYARPAHDLYISALTQDGTPGILLIEADGDVQAYDGNAYGITSLAGISFPLQSVLPHPLALKNGWVSADSPFSTGDPSYAVSGGVVYLSGSLEDGSSGVPATVLPKQARPAHRMYLLVYAINGSTAVMRIDNNGQVRLYGGNAAEFTSLAGISYPAPGAKWHSFKLVNGWKSDQSDFPTGAPSYAVINGVVYMSGSLTQSHGQVRRWTQLPATVRPADLLQIFAYGFDGNSASIVLSAGSGQALSDPQASARKFTSLAGIAYPLSS